MLRPIGPAAATFWLIAAFFPLAFTDIAAGQRGGFILLLAMAALSLRRRRPAIGGRWPEAAAILTTVTLFTIVLAAFWRRSGWSPVYGLAIGFSLGALVPTEVFPYQFLPLLPLVLVVAIPQHLDRLCAGPLRGLRTGSAHVHRG